METINQPKRNKATYPGGVSRNEQDWTKSCPICFVEHVPLAQSGYCGHAFCIECLEKFFVLPPEHTAASPQEITDINYVPNSVLDVMDLRECSIESIATLGRCPLCRSPMSLMDMMHVTTRQPVWSSGRQLNMEETPLAGKVYARRRGIRYNSFHFPPCSAVEDLPLPYLLWQEDDSLYPTLKNDSTNDGAVGPSTPTKYVFDHGCFYFAPKRTFHGRVSLPDSHGNLQPHDVLLSFANNHKCVTGGFMLRHNATTFDSNNLEASQQQYPLEGKWKVTWYSERLLKGGSLGDYNPDNLHDLIVDTDYVNVIGNTVRDMSPLHYMLRYEEDRIYFHWAGMKVTQTLEPECDFRKTTSDYENGKVPAVGDYLKWTTTDPQQPYIVWQRESIGDSIPTSTSIEYFGRSGGDSLNRYNIDPIFARMRSDQSWYREWHPSEVSSGRHVESNRGSESGTDGGRPPFHANQLWGNTFCQGLRVGLASYHFGMRAETHGNDGGSREGQPFAYISYENEACLQWPPLDDGSPIPPQVYFQNMSVEEVEEVEETRPNPSIQNRDTEENGDTAEENTISISTTAHVVFRGNVLSRAKCIASLRLRRHHRRHEENWLNMVPTWST